MCLDIIFYYTPNYCLAYNAKFGIQVHILKFLLYAIVHKTRVNPGYKYRSVRNHLLESESCLPNQSLNSTKGCLESQNLMSMFSIHGKIRN